MCYVGCGLPISRDALESVAAGMAVKGDGESCGGQLHLGEGGDGEGVTVSFWWLDDFDVLGGGVGLDDDGLV